MRKLSINMPLGQRLDLLMVKRRDVDVENEPLIPTISELKKVRRGHKISRFFRHFFQHSKLSRILGANLVILAIASSFVPVSYVDLEEFGTPSEETILAIETVLTTEPGLSYPIESPIINQSYSFYHPAIDFEGKTGQSVSPFMAGRVEATQYLNSGFSAEGILSLAYGNAVLVRHTDTLTSLYAHLSKILVQAGDAVTTHSVLGEVGSTGRSTGDHLHFEVREKNYPINPFTLLPR